MRGSLKRSAVALAAMLLVALAVTPIATAAADTAENVPNGDEAWFLKNKEPLASGPAGDPTCQLPTGCNAAGNVVRPAGPHPEGVLVVAANAGDDDAQMFFNFAMDKFPLGTVVTGGTVTLPVATDSDARAVRPEDAKLVACMVTGFIPGGADGGSYNDRPAFDDKTCVPVEQDAKAETLTYTINLDRFGKVWSTGTQPVNGVTVMKDPEITPPAPDETWRVVFNSTRRHEKAENPDDFPAITSTLQLKTLSTGGGLGLGGGSTPPPPPPPALDTSTGGTSTGTTSSPSFSAPSSGGSFDSGTVTADTGSVQSPVTAGSNAVPPATAGQPVAAAPEAVPTAAPGTSPAVWLMPLLGLAMAGALAWSLLQPVELAGDREGAVSKLMRNRRLSAGPS